VYVSVNQVISHYSCDEILYEPCLKCSCNDLYKLQCVFSKVSENFMKLVAQFAITPKKGHLAAQAYLDSPSSNTVIYILLHDSQKYFGVKVQD